MATPTELRTAIATRLKTIAALKGQAFSREPNGLPSFPCAIVGRARSEPEQTFGRGDLTLWHFDVTMLVSLAPGYEAAHDQLDRLLATSSTGGVLGAINGDRTLGGKADTVIITDLGEDSQFDLSPDIAALGTIVNLEVWAA